MNITINLELPEDLVAYIKEAGSMEWGSVGPKTDDEHVGDFAKTLRLTREHFQIQGAARLHGLYSKGTETLMACTGTSPTAPQRSRILDCLWNALHAQVVASAPVAANKVTP